MPWPKFWAYALRIPRFEARRSLELLDAVAAGAGSLFDESGKTQQGRDRLFRRAYPVKRQGPRFALIQSVTTDG